MGDYTPICNINITVSPPSLIIQYMNRLFSETIHFIQRNALLMESFRLLIVLSPVKSVVGYLQFFLDLYDLRNTNG